MNDKENDLEYLNNKLKDKDTEEEIKNMKPQILRNTIKITYSKQWDSIGKKITLSNKDNNEGMISFNDNKEQNYKFHLNKKIYQIGLQCSFDQIQNSTQTPFFKLMNKNIQTNVISNKIIFDDKYNDKLLYFLKDINYLIEEALTENETVNIFYNDLEFQIENENENNKDSKTTELSIIEELKSYEYETSKGKIVSCVKFQPKTDKNMPNLLAVSFIENLDFKERIEMNGRSYTNEVFLWDYMDNHLFNPLAILNSPLEILNIEFKPNNPNILIGGAINGQIIMWDLKGKINIVNNNVKNIKKKENEEIIRIDAVLISSLQELYSIPPIIPVDIYSKKIIFSHKNPILNIEFLPSDIELDKKNPLNIISKSNKEYNQFCSFSCDGQLLFWDLRFQEKDSRGRSIINEKGDIDYSLLVWKAILSVQLFKPENAGVMTGSFFTFKRGVDIPALLGSSDEGEIFLAEYLSKPSDDLGKIEIIKKVWNTQKNGRGIINLELSPFFNDIFLTIQELNFFIWKENCDKPIFCSPTSEFTKISCGMWSPSRPGVIYIGKNDGMIDIWDFIDQSSNLTQQHLVAASGVYSFKINELNPNIMAVGDKDGCLHLLTLPKNLSKKVNKEENIIYEFFKKEEERVKYFNVKFEELEENKRNILENHDYNNKEDDLLYKDENIEKKEDNTNKIEDLYKKLYNDFFGIIEEIKDLDNNNNND